MNQIKSPPPVVSVVSAWFNRRDTVKDSVLSVLGQTGVDVEYIVVDDCSTDGAYEALRAIDDSRLTVLRNDPNIGFTRSMRRAIDAARGEFVAVHDAGDISLPGRLSAQAAFLRDNPDFVAVGVGVVNHVVATGARKPHRTKVAGLADGEPKYTHGEVMFRRDVYDRVGGYRELFYYSQDLDLWYRLRGLGRLGLIEDVLYERRIFDDGVEGSPQKKLAQAVFASLAIHAEECRRAGRPDPASHRHALALLRQPPSAHSRRRLVRSAKPMLLKGDFTGLREGLDVVPVGLLTVRMLAAYILARIVTSSGRHPG